ncbi:diguanylate cyclase [Pannus brasiliensis CCIBt3594]|uniref:Diguanylate cyclase n=1 Tax=Pannus brasiliensis CCIBt3594 TaxID=1427578 RepID=A0AAW9QI99_9CHRO
MNSARNLILGWNPGSKGREQPETADLAREISRREATEIRLRELNERLIERVRELETRVEEMNRLGEIVDFLQTCPTVAEIGNTLADRLHALFPGSSGAIFLAGNYRPSWESVAVWGKIPNHPDFPARNDRLSRPENAVGFLGSEALLQAVRDRSPATLRVPLEARGENLGFLYLVFDDPRRLTPEKRELAKTTVKQIALGLANLQARERLQTLSFSDPLTGLYNRRYLEATLEREFNRCARDGRPIGIIFLDIDHFKRINDTFGHETGDKVLAALGDYLKTNTRQSDIACRYGGEEFVLVLLDSSREDTRKRAEELCRGVRELKLTREHPELSSISVSIGVSAFPEDGTTPAELFRVADEGLYRAKRSGRDRVCRAG